MSLSQHYVFAIGTALVVGGIAVAYYFNEKKKQWRKVAQVSDLFLHPVKSMRGIRCDKLLCFKKGFRLCDQSLFDRSFLVIQPDGNMMTARKEPKLVTINVDLKEHSIVLTAPGTSSIEFPIPESQDKAVICKVWGEKTFGVDCGDEVSKWISVFLGSEYRLVYHVPAINGRKIAARDLKRKDTFASSGNIMYHDTTPGHLLSTASLVDLNSKVDKQLSTRSFRPNIVVDGCKPYEEDEWMQVKIGGAEFIYVRDTYRCVLTTVDPETGLKSFEEEPLKTLRKYRFTKKEDLSTFGNSPPFGISLAVTKEGVISLGDDVYVC